ncbi:hypothetical protein K466DRAFT_571296, partial [Polyporus arcularius HHB13444]
QWSCKSERRCGGGAGRVYEFVRRAEGQGQMEQMKIKLNRPGTAWDDHRDDDEDDDDNEGDHDDEGNDDDEGDDDDDDEGDDDDDDDDDDEDNDDNDLNTNEMTATAIELTMKKRQWFPSASQMQLLRQGVNLLLPDALLGAPGRLHADGCSTPTTTVCSGGWTGTGHLGRGCKSRRRRTPLSLIRARNGMMVTRSALSDTGAKKLDTYQWFVCFASGASLHAASTEMGTGMLVACATL